MVDHPILLRGMRSSGISQRPTLIERTDQDFVAALMAQMGEGVPGLSQIEHSVVTRRDQTTNALKLNQPIQRTFNLAMLEAVCDLDIYGVPAYVRVDTQKIESAGLVVRRLAVDRDGYVIPGAYEGWRSAKETLRGWVRFQSEAEAKLDPDPERRAVFTLGHPNLDRRLSLFQALPVGLSEDVSPLFVSPPNLCDAMDKTVLFGLVNVASSEFSARPDEDLLASPDLVKIVPRYLREGTERKLKMAGQTVTAAWADHPSLKQLTLFLRQLTVEFDILGDGPASQDLYTAISGLGLEMPGGAGMTSIMPAGQFITDAISVLIAREAGEVTLPMYWPAISEDQADIFRRLIADALEARLRFIQPNEGRFDARDRQYAVRAFVRLNPEPGCPPEIIWSDYSEPFVIAPWYETGDVPPIRIEVPNAFDPNLLKNLKPNVAFDMPAPMFNLIQNMDPKKIMDGVKPDMGGIDLGWICSMSASIIFMVAFMLLFMFIIILNLIFQWMMFVKICIPIPKKA